MAVRAGHVALSVSNLNKSISFYAKHFHLACSQKFKHHDQGLTIALLGKGDITLELFAFKKHKPLPRYRRNLSSDLGTIGVKHFSFSVGNIESIYRQLKKAHVRFATGIHTFDNGQRYFFIKDPDGILIEIMEEAA